MASSELIMTEGSAPSTPASGKSKLFFNSSKNPASIDDTGRTIDLVIGPATYQATPGNPTGTTNTSGLMAGLAGAITPAFSGRVMIIISGRITNSGGTAGQGAAAAIRYGTGSAPANGAALTGTEIGNITAMLLERSTASDPFPFTCSALVTGLVLGTAYWIDLRQAASVGGTGVVSNISISAFEV